MMSGIPVVKLGLSLVLAWAAIRAWVPASADPEGWSDDLRLTWTELYCCLEYNNAKKLACDGFDNVHVMWGETDFQSGFNDIYYICKPAGGTAWNEPVRVGQGIEASLPASACDPSGNVHVVWCDGFGVGYWMSIRYRKHDGASWGPIQSLNDDAYDSWNPAIAADGWGRVHVVWADFRDGNEEVYYKQFDGTSWGPDVRLTNAPQYSRFPSIAVDSQGVVHVVWVDNRYGGWVLCHKRLNQSGWSPDTVLAPSYCNHSAIAVGPDDAVHVVWDGTPDEVYYKQRDGSGWGPTVQLTSAAGVSRYPSVAADVSGNVHVAWFDDCDGNDEIYCRIREGTTWGPAERLTDAAGTSDTMSGARSRRR